MTTFCQSCPNPAPSGERFCAHCEEIAINENLNRFRSNVRREFTEEARREAIRYMGENEVVRITSSLN